MTGNNFETEQEAFWAGDFGDDYVSRNDTPDILAANVALFAKLIGHTGAIDSAIELGANIGMNLRALHQLMPAARLAGVEINARAAAALRQLGYVDVHEGSMLEYRPEGQFDLVFIKGVLIHISPDHLSTVYDALHAASRRYVCLVEYYNPTPVSIPYRGHAERLFKRDFAGELMDRHRDLRLVAYGFNYHRDPAFDYGDETWFLMEKT